jgi:hypothetical protein
MPCTLLTRKLEADIIILSVIVLVRMSFKIAKVAAKTIIIMENDDEFSRDQLTLSSKF